MAKEPTIATRFRELKKQLKVDDAAAALLLLADAVERAALRLDVSDKKLNVDISSDKLSVALSSDKKLNVDISSDKLSVALSKETDWE